MRNVARLAGKPRGIAAVVAVLMLVAGCGVAEQPLLPTPRPTFTATLEPTATFTPVFNASATPPP